MQHIFQQVPDGGREVPVLSHIVRALPQPVRNAHSLRIRLGIPGDATVFGRHGGADQFNVHFVPDVIGEVPVFHATNYPKQSYILNVESDPRYILFHFFGTIRRSLERTQILFTLSFSTQIHCQEEHQTYPMSFIWMQQYVFLQRLMNIKSKFSTRVRIMKKFHSVLFCFSGACMFV